MFPMIFRKRKSKIMQLIHIAALFLVFTTSFASLLKDSSSDCSVFGCAWAGLICVDVGDGELCKMSFIDHLTIVIPQFEDRCHNNMYLYVKTVSKSVYHD